MGLDPASLSPAFRRCMVSEPAKLPPMAGTVTKKSKAEKMNKTERRCLEMLQNMDASGFAIGHNFKAFTRVRFEAITLYLANDCRYTPDFYCEGQLKPIFVEAKGSWKYEDAWIKFKTAVEIFPSFSFYFAEWKSGAWTFTKFS